jgi:hypothetical protein
MVKCPNCKTEQFPSSVKVTRDGRNEIVEYWAACFWARDFRRRYFHTLESHGAARVCSPLQQ